MSVLSKSHFEHVEYSSTPDTFGVRRVRASHPVFIADAANLLLSALNRDAQSFAVSNSDFSATIRTAADMKATRFPMTVVTISPTNGIP